MTRTVRTAAGRRRGLGTVLGGGILFAAALAACRGDDATPPALATAMDEAEGEGADQADEASASADAARDLWFSSGPGREAILAREREDHERARAELDTLLADTSLSADARGAALLLRGLEHLDQGQPEQAAERFAAARESSALAPIELWLRRWEAQARLDAGQPERARELIDGVDATTWSKSALGGDAWIILADARRRTQDPEGAEKAYREYLRVHGEGERRFEARAKLAGLLLELEDAAKKKEALRLYDQLREAVPLSDYSEEAERAIPALERELGALRSGADAREHERELQVLQAEALLDRGRYKSAIAVADKLVTKGKPSAAQRCRAWYVKGSAIFKQRRRADARAPFDRADRECAKAGKTYETLRVKSRYQAARGWYAAGKYAKAGQAFEALAAEHPTHSYADDALVLAGESWESHDDEDKAAKAYRRAIEDHPGDMIHEARRRLLVMRFAAKAHDDALSIIDGALERGVTHPVERSKLLYFRGKALLGLGREDEAQAAWLEAIEAAPLDYPSLQALSRLKERGEEALAQGLARLSGPEGEPASIPREGGDALARAELLARLGLGDEARVELGHAKIDGWPAVAVLTQAGLHPAAQRQIANLGLAWRRQPPGAENLQQWHSAHPRPFSEIIAPGEQEHEVPSLLTYAIMQTESRFDPGVTSFAGARGLVQLMPATAKGLAKSAGVELKGNAALFDPSLNLDLGMRYLGRLSARYDGDNGAVALAIPSYNAGAGSVDRWLSERGDWELDLFIESIPYDETRRYTQSVLGRWLSYRWLYGEGDPAQRVPLLPAATPAKAGK